MKSYSIISVDANQHQETIIKLWNEYLPGTPAQRFDWMMQGNPAGPPDWYFAIDDNDQNIVGMISILPRRLYLHGNTLRAGIMGDFVVTKSNRVFGPALSLVKHAIKDMKNRGYDLLYTIPNNESSKLLQRAGFIKIFEMNCFVSPIDIRNYINKRIPGFIVSMLSFLYRNFLRLFDINIYRKISNVTEIEIENTKQLHQFIGKIHNSSKRIIGDISTEFLNWRYRENPHAIFKYFAYLDNNTKEYKGIAIISYSKYGIEIYDLIVLTKFAYYSLISAIRNVALKDSIPKIYFRISNNFQYYDCLKYSYFYNAKDSFNIKAYGSNDIFNNYSIMSCDRNL